MPNESTLYSTKCITKYVKCMNALALGRRNMRSTYCQQLLGRTCLKYDTLLLFKMFLSQHSEHAQCSELSEVHSISLPSKHWEKESSSVTRGPNRLAALQLSELASSWADSICLTFTVWHMEPWAGNKVFGLAHVHLKNSVLDCWPALKYLVLITATTFTLAGYCWNIIPKGLHCKGITPLFSHRRDGSHSLSQAGFFIWDMGHSHNRLYRLPLTKSNRKLWDERHSITLNYTAAETEEHSLSLWWGWWIFELLSFDYLPCSPVCLDSPQQH